MRKIQILPVLIYLFFLILICSSSFFIHYSLFNTLEIPLDIDLKNVISYIFFFYIFLIIFYRFWIKYFDFEPGEITHNSKRETVHQVRMIFDLLFFDPFTSSNIIPAPLTRPLVRLLGAKLGEGTYPGNSALFDRHFITIGKGTILGHHSLITPHIMRFGRLTILPVNIGDNVTIAVNTVIFGDVVIKDEALILANSSVVPGTVIEKGEIWGGNPAVKLKD
jgi:acetyltransferase-like isoleucine patch superfamily enzyme